MTASRRWPGPTGCATVELRDLFLADPTLAVDNSDQLLYIDALAPGEEAAAAPSADPDGPAGAPPTDGPEFQLASLPGADKTIYLDFDGHVTTGTNWNSQYGVTTIVSSPYDTSGDNQSWSASELQVIRDTWAVVAEDFAPWNVNVTTIEPSVDDLRRSGSGDTRWGARVVFTPDDWSGCGCGGHAYIGAFDDAVDEPTFVYNRSFVGASEAASHEVGHMLGLAHDGLSSGTAYYTGHQGAGEPGWAPIMGVAYYQPVGQWSFQEYFGANNDTSSANYGRGRDDVAIISSLTNGNGFGVKPDDHGDPSSPTPLNGGTPSIDGVIATRTDVDAFSFTTTGGQVSFTATGDAISSNLDIELTLRNGFGTVMAQDNPIGSLDASLTATVGAGTYTVAIDGVGVGNPFVDPPTGYTDYGSLGQYNLSGTIEGVGPPDTEAPATPTGLTGATGAGGGEVDLTWTANTEEDLADYLVRRSTSAGGPYTTIGTATSASFQDPSPVVGDNHYVVAARDASGNVSADSDEVVVNVAAQPQHRGGHRRDGRPRDGERQLRRHPRRRRCLPDDHRGPVRWPPGQPPRSCRAPLDHPGPRGPADPPGGGHRHRRRRRRRRLLDRVVDRRIAVAPPRRGLGRQPGRRQLRHRRADRLDPGPGDRHRPQPGGAGLRLGLDRPAGGHR